MKMFLKAMMLFAALMLSHQAYANEAFQTATTVAEAKRAGGQQISGESVRKIVTNRTLSSPNFSWTFKSNGTQSSKAHNGGWKSRGTWEIKGNMLCRTDEGTKRCSNVYLLGRDLKFTETGSKRKLSNWFVSF